MKNIVIVGGGYAGILTAKKLAKKLKKETEVSIRLIDKNPFHTMLTELHEVAAGRVEEDSIRISYEKVFAGRPVSFVHDLVTSFDFDKKLVCGEKENYEYDYLVIAAGSRPSYFGAKGAEEHSYTLWSYEDAVRLKERILNCFRQASVATDPKERKRLLSFYVVGAGFTGVEMIGELAEYVPFLCQRFEIDPHEVSLVNVDVLSRVVPTLPEKLSSKIQRRLEKMGVDVLLGHKVTEIGKDFIELDCGGQTFRHEAATVIWVAGIEASEAAAKAGAVLPNRNRGRLETDEYLRSVANDCVYIAGDNIFFVPEGADSPVPQMVENCEQSAHTVAQNIYHSLSSKGEMEKYAPKFHGVMVCVGGRYGQARVGTDKFQINLASFFAMFVKHFINIVYFVQVLGWNKVFSYMKHEFFTIRNKRSFVGGHFSNRSPTFMLLPLRLWLGLVWVYEGVMKIMQDWLKEPKLEGFFGGASAWFQSIIGAGDGVSGATDAVSAATGAAGDGAGQLIFNWNIFGLFKMIFVSGKELAQSELADFAFKLDVPLMNLFVDRVIVPRQGLQLFMQISIVCLEILIGLSMIGGLFTTFSAAFSIILLLMFMSTTGLYMTSFWMLVGAVALMFGASSVFGLDYYVS
ncbi:MAG: NAD(P)/FAD-dependent oxidoreductase, partial [Clostridiales bacterium]|nr:NAD(P)/FAD-dependent oxidoreductase [Clostridiales bacterium]